MALDLRLQQKMTQQLVMTPQLQHAIKLLQLSHLEMAEALREELEQNPVLEERNEHGAGDGFDDAPPDDAHQDDKDYAVSKNLDDMPMDASPVDNTHADDSELAPGHPDSDFNDELASLSESPLDATPEPSDSDVEKEIDWEAYLDSHSFSLPATAGAGGAEELPSFEATLSKTTSLLEHLRWQVQMAELTPEAAQIALLLVEEINEDGYLATDAIDNVADELGVETALVENVLQDLQEFDPVGVAARDLRECLLIQARHLSYVDPLALQIIDKHLHDLERRNLAAIAKELKVSVAGVSQAIKTITGMEPRPGRIFHDRPPQYITPDIYVHKVGSEHVITLNEEGLPRLRISNYYREAMRGAGGQAKSYIQEKLRNAAWLIRSIHMRQRTIYRVMESILKFQRDFFDKGVVFLKPLILKEVAEDVGMHESTISRVTTNKYVHTPQGIYELKYFFNSSIQCVDGDNVASESVRNHIERLIGEEDPQTPYSDQRIVEILKKRDIDIARRTVAKYRDMLRIPPSSKRKRVF